VRNFRNIIWNSKLNIYTDNKNLTYSPKILSTRDQKWKNELEEYDFNISYIKGKETTCSDFLSRNFMIGTKPKLAEIVKNYQLQNIEELKSNSQLKI